MAKLEKRRDSDGRVRFSFRYTDVNGQRKRHTPDVANAAEALRIQSEVLARVARGIVGVPEPASDERQRNTITLTELWKRWDREVLPRSKVPADYKKRCATKIRGIVSVLGDIAAAELKRSELRRLMDLWIGQGMALSTVNGIFSNLSMVWKWGQETGLIAETATNPTRGIFHQPLTGSVDFLSTEEVGSLLAYVAEKAPTLHPMIATAVYTGMRKGELYGLRWSAVHLDIGTIRVERSYLLLPKSGKPRTIPLHPALAPILREWRRQCPRTPDNLVFPIVADVQTRMGKSHDGQQLPDLLREAGCHVPDKPWHALRHTFASYYIMSGGNLLALQQIMGHHDIKMTMAYSHLAPNYHAADMARLSYGSSGAAEVIPISTGTRRKRGAA